MKLQYIYKKRQHETIKNITTEITNHVAKQHSKELTEKMLRYWERECKSTEKCNANLKRKYNGSKRTRWLKKPIKNHKISYMKETE